jgi:hypothetical protein
LRNRRFAAADAMRHGVAVRRRQWTMLSVDIVACGALPFLRSRLDVSGMPSRGPRQSIRGNAHRHVTSAERCWTTLVSLCATPLRGSRSCLRDGKIEDASSCGGPPPSMAVPHSGDSLSLQLLGDEMEVSMWSLIPQLLRPLL